MRSKTSGVLNDICTSVAIHDQHATLTNNFRLAFCDAYAYWRWPHVHRTLCLKYHGIFSTFDTLRVCASCNSMQVWHLRSLKRFRWNALEETVSKLRILTEMATGQKRKQDVYISCDMPEMRIVNNVTAKSVEAWRQGRTITISVTEACWSLE